MAKRLTSEAYRQFLPEDEDEFRWKYGLDADRCPEHIDSEYQWIRYKNLDRVAVQLLRWAEQLGGAGGDRRALEDELERMARDELPADPSGAPPPGSLIMAFGEDGVDVIKVPEGEELPPEIADRGLAELDFIRLLLNFELTDRQLERATKMTDRAVELLDFLASARNERTKAYLGRVAQCYLLGLDTEGAVMCRSVLEAALEEEASDAEVKSAGYAEQRFQHVSLNQRLQFLRARGMLSGGTYAAANRVRDAGNNAVHTAPGLVNLKNVLADLISVLDSVEDSEGP